MNKKDITVDYLVEFDEEIRQLFLDSKILSPIHLSVGSENGVINIFKNIKKEDWVFSTHRSHYHALLKGVPREWLKNEILANRSMHINSKEHNFFSSAIVAGNVSIAVGVSMGLKLGGMSNKVWVFCGDMSASMGVTYECMKYAARNDLPIAFVVEDNGLSVETPTDEVWGTCNGKAEIYRYRYNRKYPHQGCGKWVVF